MGGREGEWAGAEAAQAGHTLAAIEYALSRCRW